jgi:hypothetical protein
MLPVCAPQILRVLQDPRLGDEHPRIAYLCFYALARVCWVDESTKDFLVTHGAADKLFLAAAAGHGADSSVLAQACKFVSIALLHPAVFSGHAPEEVYRAVEGVLHAHVKEAEPYGYACHALCGFFLRGEKDERRAWVDHFLQSRTLDVAVRGFRKNLRNPLACYSFLQLLATASKYADVMAAPELAAVVPWMEEARKLHDTENISKYTGRLLRDYARIAPQAKAG